MASMKSLLSICRPNFISVLVLFCLLPAALCKGSFLSNDQADELVKRGSPSTWWFANIYRNGTVPWGPANYTVFRNVMDFGAYGTVVG
jgi:hypothetical protein